MAYKTKREKQAYKTGLLNGLKRGKSKSKTSRNVSSGKRASRHKIIKRRIGGGAQRSGNPFGMTYRQYIAEEEMRKRDLFGDFEYDHKGRIKGAYTPDGFFEPD